MAYAITEYEFWGNPKVREAGKDAVLMYLAGNSYCNQYVTDGLITFASISTVASLAFQRNPDKAVKALVDNRLWLKVKTGYQVHDYLKHNKSKAQVEELSIKNSTAGKASVQARAQRSVEQNVEHSVEQNVNRNIEHEVEFHVEPAFNPLLSSLFSNSKDLKDLPPLLDARDELVGSIFKSYEHEIGMITPTVADDIKSAVEDYPLDWFGEAFKEAARNNKRNWRYALAILTRWKIEGFKVDTRTKQPARGNNGGNGKNGSRRRVPDMGNYVVSRTNEVVIIDDGSEVIDEL